MNLQQNLKLQVIENTLTNSGSEVLTDNFGQSPIEVFRDAVQVFPIYSSEHFVNDPDRILNLHHMRTACIFGHRDSEYVNGYRTIRVRNYHEFFFDDLQLHELIDDIMQNISHGPLQNLNMARATVTSALNKCRTLTALSQDGVDKSGIMLHLAEGFFSSKGFQSVSYYELRILTELAKKDQSIFDSMPVIIVADLPNSDLCL